MSRLYNWDIILDITENYWDNILLFWASIKGTVSRELRPMLLYIIQKLFSRPIVALHKIYILLKGQSAINKKPFSVS